MLTVEITCPQTFKHTYKQTNKQASIHHSEKTSRPDLMVRLKMYCFHNVKTYNILLKAISAHASLHLVDLTWTGSAIQKRDIRLEHLVFSRIFHKITEFHVFSWTGNHSLIFPGIPGFPRQWESRFSVYVSGSEEGISYYHTTVIYFILTWETTKKKGLCATIDKFV